MDCCLSRSFVSCFALSVQLARGFKLWLNFRGAVRVGPARGCSCVAQTWGGLTDTADHTAVHYGRNEHRVFHLLPVLPLDLLHGERVGLRSKMLTTFNTTMPLSCNVFGPDVFARTHSGYQ